MPLGALARGARVLCRGSNPNDRRRDNSSGHRCIYDGLAGSPETRDDGRRSVDDSLGEDGFGRHPHDVAVPRLGVATGLDVVVRAYGHGSRAPGRPGSGGLLGYRAPELVGVLEGVERGR